MCVQTLSMSECGWNVPWWQFIWVYYSICPLGWGTCHGTILNLTNNMIRSYFPLRNWIDNKRQRRLMFILTWIVIVINTSLILEGAILYIFMLGVFETRNLTQLSEKKKKQQFLYWVQLFKFLVYIIWVFLIGAPAHWLRIQWIEILSWKHKVLLLTK